MPLGYFRLQEPYLHYEHKNNISIPLQVEYEYSFIEHGHTYDSTVLKYFTTEAASAYKKALYCIVSTFTIV